MKRLSKDFWSTEDVSILYDIALSTVLYRCKVLDLKKTLLHKRIRYLLTSSEVNDIVSYNSIENTKEIIYSHTTYWIIESKMNYNGGA